MTKQYTPGPWEAQGSNIISVTDGGVALVGTRMGDNAPTREQVEADARLIAAAPELVEALERTTQALSDIINAADNGEPYEVGEIEREFLADYNAGYAALAKALGE